MLNFCTYFDRNYLPRALALVESLRSCGADFRLWALCMDGESEAALNRLALPGVEPVPLAELERHDADLRRSRANRTRVEYYFTCTPSLPLYLLDRRPELQLITYLDSDLFFYHHPQPVLDELGSGSVGIIAHRFAPAIRSFERFGRYNVGWLSFRRDPSGLECLQWWRERCLEWCHDRVEPERYADQKYLDRWPSRFSGVKVIEHKGANLAPWNVANHRIRSREGRPWVDDQPLVFFHFQGFKQLAPWLYSSNFGLYRTRPSSVVRREVIAPYVRALRRATGGAASPRGLRDADRRFGRFVRNARQAARVGLGLLTQEYVLVIGDRIY